MFNDHISAVKIQTLWSSVLNSWWGNEPRLGWVVAQRVVNQEEPENLWWMEYCGFVKWPHRSRRKERNTGGYLFYKCLNMDCTVQSLRVRPLNKELLCISHYYNSSLVGLRIIRASWWLDLQLVFILWKVSYSSV